MKGRAACVIASLAIASVSLAMAPELAEGAPSSSSREGYPCAKCLFVAPNDIQAPVPLLVVLHGDAPSGKTPLVKRDTEPFFQSAAERSIAVLAPMCPKSEGCSVGSFWQWSQGDPPGWIAAQIDAVKKDFAIDPNRIWIAGWSGGASFLGYHYHRLGERYAAVVFIGGGMPPGSSDCAPCSPPAYFLVGDKNPLHHLARQLKEDVSTCSRDVTWNLLPGKDHVGEWRAYSMKGRAAELLDWLDKHPRNCPARALPSASVAASSSVQAVVPTVSAAPLVTLPIAPTPAKVASPNPAGRRGCHLAYDSTDSDTRFGLLGVCLLLVFRRLTPRACATIRTETDPKMVS